jgi:hypothetical protein
MAKATDKFITWILLRDAQKRVADFCQSPSLAQRLLVRALAAGQVRWRCLGLEGLKHDTDPGIGAPDFWQDVSPGSRIVRLQVFWAESRAQRNGMWGYTAYKIELAEADVATLLRGQSDTADGPQVARVKKVLQTLYPPAGRVPNHIKTNEVHASASAELEKQGEPSVSRDTVARAIGRR